MGVGGAAREGEISACLCSLLRVGNTSILYIAFRSSANRKAQAFVKLLGRGETRIFYCILGSAIAMLGLLITFGVMVKNVKHRQMYWTIAVIVQEQRS
jgi:hypothetical protein